MKKIIAVFGSLLVLASTKSKAQNPQQPVKKETVKPTSGTAPKADAVEIFLNLDNVKPDKGANPTVAKGTNPAFLKTNPAVAKGVNPAFLKTNPTLKNAQPATNQQVAPRPTPPKNNQVASHNHMGPKG